MHALKKIILLYLRYSSVNLILLFFCNYVGPSSALKTNNLCILLVTLKVMSAVELYPKKSDTKEI